jgi:hypothetical protein
LVIFGLIGLASPIGVVALLNAQARLDRQLELSVQGAGAPLQALKSSTRVSAEATWPNDHAPTPPTELARINRLPAPPAIELIPAEGKKAVVVRVSNGLNAIDFAQPGRWVDVILTRQVETNAIFNDVVVQSARILAVDSDGDGRDRSMARSVTLEVDLVGAQKLLLASQVGFLSLILGRPGDLPTQNTRQVDIDDLRSPSAEPAPPAPASVWPAPAETDVETTASIAAPAAVTEQPPAPAPSAVADPMAAPAQAPTPAPSPPSETATEATATATAPPQTPTLESAVAPATSPAAAQTLTSGPSAPGTESATTTPTTTSATTITTSEPAPEQDDSRFLWVRVNRPGAEPSVHRVPKEQ